MKFTALTVSKYPVERSFAGLATRCLSGRIFSRASHAQAAWLDAIDLVQTPYFFYIDDDDELPQNYLEVLEACARTGAAVSYTDEIVNGERRRRSAYSQQAHLANPCLVHHLVLCETAIARSAAAALPRGDFWPEMQLFWQMAKLGGAAYVPVDGYLWNKRKTGLHTAWFTVFGISNSRHWCAANP